MCGCGCCLTLALAQLEYAERQGEDVSGAKADEAGAGARIPRGWEALKSSLRAVFRTPAQAPRSTVSSIATAA